MTDRPPTCTVDAIALGRVFRFGSILKAVGTAMRPSRIGIAMLTLALIVGGGRIWDAVIGPEDLDVPVVGATMLAINMPPPFERTEEWVAQESQALVSAVQTLDTAAFLEASWGLFVGTPQKLWATGQHWFLVCFGLWTAAVLAIGGGTLCRMEAVEISTDDAPPVNPALGMAIARWPSFFGALLIPAVLAVVLALGLMVFGFVLLNIPLLNILGGLAYGLALLIGLGIALIVAGFFVAWPLLLPAVAAEACDGPDAMHRACAYVVAQPLRWVLYAVMLALGLALGLIVVLTVLGLTQALTEWLVGYWHFGDTMAASAAYLDDAEVGDAAWWSRWSGGLVAFWTSMLAWVAASWALAYLMNASTRAYLLMRLACDDQDERDIWWPGLVPGTLAPMPSDDD